MPARGISLQALRYLVEVVEAGSFARAAVRLGVNSSTLTRRVADLEDGLGLTLLERSRVGVRVTTSGRGVVEQIRRALGEFEAVEHAARLNGRGAAGEIRVGFRVPPISVEILGLLSDWRQDHPEVSLVFFEMTDNDVRLALAERKIDVAFVERELLWPDAAHVPVYQEPILLALPTIHPLARFERVCWRQLRGETLLAQGCELSQSAKKIVKSLLGNDVHYETHSASKQSMLALVAAGYGIALAVHSQLQASVPGVVFRPIGEPSAVVDIELAWLPEFEDAVGGLFISFMRDRSLGRSA